MSVTAGAVIIPAHNEANVVRRTLEPLSTLACRGTVEVLVVANGCTDDTSRVARGVPGVRVLEISEASKAAALNAGDNAVSGFPRMYLDADIEVAPAAVLTVFRALTGGPALAARPPFVYDTAGATWLVRAYFRARSRLPDNGNALWGAGCYALSREGRGRFDAFPSLLADDYFVDSLFPDTDKQVVPTTPVVVRTPRTASALRAVLRRTYAGNAQLGAHLRSIPGADRSRTHNVRDLMRSVRSAASLVDAAVYAAFGLIGRVQARRNSLGWSRDESTRN